MTASKSLSFAALLAVGVTFALFQLMAIMVSGNSGKVNSSDSEQFIEFVRIKNDTHLDVKKRELPQKPQPEAKKPPPMPRPKIASADPQPQAKIPAMIPNLNLPIGPGDGPAIAGGGGYGSGGELVPLVRIEPQYPRQAAMAGKEGWVRLAYDINSQGSVENVEVVSAEPKRTFESAARQALLRWKYKPKVVEGQAIAIQGNEVTIEFKLTR